jgi:hypothetical protein
MEQYAGIDVSLESASVCVVINMHRVQVAELRSGTVFIERSRSESETDPRLAHGFIARLL